jgi:general stress protein 26
MLHLSEEQKNGLNTLRDKIKDIKVAMLSTEDASRKSIHGRPMTTLPYDENDAENELYFFTYGNSEKAFDISKNPHVGLLYADHDKKLYISVSGEAEIVDDYALIKKKWNPIMKAWMPETYQNPEVKLLRVKINEVEYWDSSSNLMVNIFSMVKAMVTGKRANPNAEHEKINLRKV